jgi:hypothetical protein
MYFYPEDETASELYKQIKIPLKDKESGNDITAEHLELTESLTRLIKAVWGGLEMKEEAKSVLRRKINVVLRQHLDRELSIFKKKGDSMFFFNF